MEKIDFLVRGEILNGETLKTNHSWNEKNREVAFLSAINNSVSFEFNLPFSATLVYNFLKNIVKDTDQYETNIVSYDSHLIYFYSKCGVKKESTERVVELLKRNNIDPSLLGPIKLNLCWFDLNNDIIITLHSDNIEKLKKIITHFSPTKTSLFQRLMKHFR